MIRALLLAPLLLLAGCSPLHDPSSIVLSPEEVDLETCPAGEAVAVETLTDDPACDLAGRDILYPDGHVETAPAVAGNQQSIADDDAWSLTNLGIYGLVAGYHHAGDDVVWWGTDRGIELVVATGDYPGEGVPAFE